MARPLDADAVLNATEVVYERGLITVKSRVWSRVWSRADEPLAGATVTGENVATGAQVKYERRWDEEDYPGQDGMAGWAELHVGYAFADSRLTTPSDPKTCKHGHTTIGFDEDRNVMNWMFCSGCGVEMSRRIQGRPGTADYGYIYEPVLDEETGEPVISERYKPKEVA